MIERLEGFWGGSGYDEHDHVGTYPHETIKFTSAFCGRDVASEKGWNCKAARLDRSIANIRFCPYCNRPSFFEGISQFPRVPAGESVEHLPDDISKLYNEARLSAGANAPTAAVLALRKLLMNVAVQKGAKPNQTFQQYVTFFSTEGYVPRGNEHWVDHIRERGNDANHEIALMEDVDAARLIEFAGMLLKLVYEFPSSLPKRVPVTP